ncbi:uncharacterized protein LOC115225996 [Octopus sinensis]|uniref:Uncharacterized protein LOC115225996 n=1 Tax=Octopus sinensis TaxID=2607531 RepID=A0A7E6FTF6_9MOLL|nr:uncharacterized protein LOC115225996 [Octopus sinensis]
MAVQFSNRTLLSTTDQSNHRYWAEFEYKPVKEGSSMYVFKGRLNGDGPRSGEYCAVKMFRKFVAEPSDWNQYVAKANMANILAEKFNNKLKGQYKVQFLIPILAHLDTVSTCTGCLYWCSDIKAIDTDDCVVVEPYLRHGFRKFYRNSPLKGAENAYILQAFSHFTACETCDTLVCGLQGIAHENEFKLTNPIIHSSDKQWGSTDKGRSGIKSFFRNHSCNRICKTLNLPFLLETNEINGSVSTINNAEDEEAVEDDDVKNSDEARKTKMRDANVGTDSDNFGEETLVKEAVETTKKDNEGDDNDRDGKQDEEDAGKEDKKAVGEKLHENTEEDAEHKEEQIDANVEKKPGEIAEKSKEKKAENKIDKSVETEPFNNVENLDGFGVRNESVMSEKKIPVISEGVQATVNAQVEPNASPRMTAGVFVEQGPLLRVESEPGIYLEEGPSVSAADRTDKSVEVDADEKLMANKVDEGVQKNLESVGSVTELDVGTDGEAASYVAGTPLKVIRGHTGAASTPSNEITVISGSFDESFKGSPTSDGRDHSYSSDSSIDEISYDNLIAEKKPLEPTEFAGGETSVHGKHNLVPNYEDEENEDTGMDSGPPHHRDEIYLPPKILQTPPSNRTGRIFVVPVCRQTGSVRSATSSASVTPPVFLETVSPICRCPASFQPIANSDDVGIGVGNSPSSRTSPLPPLSPLSTEEIKTDGWSEQSSDLGPSATPNDQPNPPSPLFSSTPTPVELPPLPSPVPTESPALLSPPPPAELPPLPPTPHPTATARNSITTPPSPSTTTTTSSALPRCLRQLTSCCSMRMSKKKKKKKKEKDESPGSVTDPVTLSQTSKTEVPVETPGSKSSGKKRSRSWRTAWRSPKTSGTCSTSDTEASSPKKPAMVSIEMSAPEESDSAICPKNPFQMVTDGHDDTNRNNNNNDDDYYINAYINNNNNNINNNNDTSGVGGSEDQYYMNNNSNQIHTHQMVLQKAFVEKGQRFTSPPPLLLDSGQPESSTYWEYHCMNPDERGAVGGSGCRCCGGVGGSCSCCGSSGERDFNRMVSDSKTPPQLETSTNGSSISMTTADTDAGAGDQSHHEYDTLPRRTFDMGFEPNRGGICDTLPCRGDLFTVEVHYNGEAVPEYRADPAAAMSTMTTAVITPPKLEAMTVATTSAMPSSSSLTEIIEMVPKDSIGDVDPRLPVDGYPPLMHDHESSSGQTFSGSETTGVTTAGRVGSVGVALRAEENDGEEEERAVAEEEILVASSSLGSTAQTAGGALTDAAAAAAETMELTLADRIPTSSQLPFLKSSVDTLNSRTPDTEGTISVFSGSVQTGTDNTSIADASTAGTKPMTPKCYDDVASSLATTPTPLSLSSSSSSSSTLLLLPGGGTLQKARSEVMEKISTSTDDRSSQGPRSDIPDIPDIRLLLSEDVDDDDDGGGGDGDGDGDGKTIAAAGGGGGGAEDTADIPYIDECDSDDSVQQQQQQQQQQCEQDEQSSGKARIDTYVLDHRVGKHQQQSLAVPSDGTCGEDQQQQHQQLLEVPFSHTYGEEQQQRQQSLEVPYSDINIKQQQSEVPIDVCWQEKQQQYEVPVSGTYEQQQYKESEVPVHIYGQEQQHELPVSDTYGQQQQQCQPSEVPFSDIHGRDQQQQTEVPSSDIYSQPQTEVPSSDIYSQPQTEVPSSDVYSQHQTEVPSSDIYSQQQQTEVPSSDIYSQQQTEVPSSDIYSQQQTEVPSSDIYSQQQTEVPSSDIYSQQQTGVPSSNIYSQQQQTEVPSSDIYSQQQTEAPPTDVHGQQHYQQSEVPCSNIYSQEQNQQTEVPSTDIYGQQQQCQQSEVPSTDIYGQQQQHQQFEVPSTDIYGQQEYQQPEVPSSEIYSQQHQLQQTEVPSSNIYNQQSKVPSTDIYDQQQYQPSEVPSANIHSQQQQFEVPSTDTYGQHQHQQSEEPSSNIYSPQQQFEVPSSDIYGQQQQSQVASSDIYNQQQQKTEVPSSNIYRQQQQFEVPSTDVFGQHQYQQTERPSDIRDQQQYQPSEVPSTDIYRQRQQFEVPSTDVYGQQQYQQTERPSTDIYNQQQYQPSEVPSSDIYSQQQHQFEVPSTDVYGQQQYQQSGVPSSDIYGQQQQSAIPFSNIYSQQQQQTEVPSSNTYSQQQQYEVPSTDIYGQQQYQPSVVPSTGMYSQQQQFEVPSTDIHGQQQYQPSVVPSTGMYSQQQQHEVPSTDIHSQQYQPSVVPSTGMYSQQQQHEVPSTDIHGQQQYQPSVVPSTGIYSQQQQHEVPSTDIHGQQQYQPSVVPSTGMYSQQQQHEVPSTDIHGQQQYQPSVVPSTGMYSQQQQHEVPSTDIHGQQQYQPSVVPSTGMYSQQQQHEVPSTDIHGQQQYQPSVVPSTGMYSQQQQYEVPSTEIHGQQQYQSSVVPSTGMYSQQQQYEVPSTEIHGQQQYQPSVVPSTGMYSQQQQYEVPSTDIYGQQHHQSEVPSSDIYCQQQQSEVPSSDFCGQQQQQDQTCGESKPDMPHVPTGASCVQSGRNTKHVSFDIPSDQYDVEQESPDVHSDQQSNDVRPGFPVGPSDQCVPFRVLDDTHGVSSEQFVVVPNRNDGPGFTVSEQIPTEMAFKRSSFGNENEQPVSDSQTGVSTYSSASQQVPFEGLPVCKSYGSQQQQEQQLYEVPENTDRNVNAGQDDGNLGRNYIDTQKSDCSKTHLLPSANGNYMTKELVQGGKRLEDDKASGDSFHNLSKEGSETFLPELSLDISSKKYSGFETVIPERSLEENLRDHFDLEKDSDDKGGCGVVSSSVSGGGGGGGGCGGVDFTENSTSSTALNFPSFSPDGFVNAGLNAPDAALSANVSSSGAHSSVDSQNLFDSDFQGQRSVESLVEDIFDHDSSGIAGNRNATPGVTKTVCFQEDSKIRYDDGESDILEIRHPFLEVIPEEGENIYEDICVISEEDLENKPRYSKPLLLELRAETPKLDKHCFHYGDSTGCSANLYEELKFSGYSDQGPKKSIDDAVAGSDAASLRNFATKSSVLPAMASLGQTAVQAPKWDSPEQAVNLGGTIPERSSSSCSTAYRITTAQQPAWSLLSQPTPSPVASSSSYNLLKDPGTTAVVGGDGHDATTDGYGLGHQASPIAVAPEYTPQPAVVTPDPKSNIKDDKPLSDRRLSGPYIETERSIEIKFRINPTPSTIPSGGGGGGGRGGDRSALVTGVGGVGGNIGSRSVGGVYLQPNLEIEECNEIISVCEVDRRPDGLAGTNSSGRSDSRHSRNNSSSGSSYGRGGSSNVDVVNEDEAQRQRQCLEALIRESSSRRLSTQEALQTLLAPHWLPHT